MNPSQLYHFNADLAQPLTDSQSAKIDKTNAIIYSVSLITGGIEARGHGLAVDDKTLKQMLACGEAKGQVSVKTDHGSGTGAVNGFLTNFRIKGKKLVGDWHLLKSHAQAEHILEMAERMPKNLGLSAAFMGLPETKDGQTVFKGEDTDDQWKGKFYTITASGEKTEFKDKKFARCEELVSVDLVTQPAANPDGMFGVRVDTSGSGMGKQIQQAAATGEGEEQNAEPTIADLFQAIQDMREDVNGRLEDMENRFIDQQADEGEGEFEDEGEEEGAEGELETAGVEGGGGERGFQAGTVGAVMNQFAAKLHQFEKREVDALKRAEFAQQQHAFGVIAAKVDEVTEFAEQLVVQCNAQSELIQELQAQVKNTARVSVGHENLTVFNAPTLPGQTAFEARLQELTKKEGKTPAEATRLALKEDPVRYQTHLAAKGVIGG